MRRLICVFVVLLFTAAKAYAQLPPPAPGFEPFSFVNFETPHVHPLDLTPDGSTLLAVNTAANTLMVFDITTGIPQQTDSILVGLNPVSVRARTNAEAWVVNHVSDTVSVVNLNSGTVVATLQTDNEPADVVFAGTPRRAFVSCSEANRINVFEPTNLSAPKRSLFLNGEDPRALTVSPDGRTVYAAFFESGNGTTVIAGGKTDEGLLRMGDGIASPQGPYAGTVDVPPNDGDRLSPAINPALPPPAPVSLIVRKDDDGVWRDDNGVDWSAVVSGSAASDTLRVTGWDLPERDVALIDANTLGRTYQRRIMTTLMAIAVNPLSGKVYVVGTEAHNEIRYEPNLRGTFARVEVASFDAGQPRVTNVDLNPHLDYTQGNVPQAIRNRSIGDPRGIAWHPDGSEAYITGMGSNNLLAIDSDGNRLRRVEVGQGPTGVVVHLGLGRLFVLNKFAGSISSVDLETFSEVERTAYFDPTPQTIKAGRPLLYDTHATSGLGHVACATCHVDARTDRLGWDLGNPAGDLVTRVDTVGEPWEFHPMKGPMKTQSLQDIIGVPAMHHGGDRDDIFAFANAFVTLQGDDAPPSAARMSAFETMLDSIHFPPNPNRLKDNSLATRVRIPGPNGSTRIRANAVVGKRNYFTGENTSSICGDCHLGPRSRGDIVRDPADFIASVPTIPETFSGFYDRIGYWAKNASASNAGFGFRPDGAQGSEFFHPDRDFPLETESGVDVLAYFLSIEGPQEDVPGLSRDSHAGVGAQASGTQRDIATLRGIAESGNVGLVASGVLSGERRAFYYAGDGNYQSDRLNQTFTESALAAASRMTFTLVPVGTQYGIAVDRDLDGVLNQDEIDAGTNPDQADDQWQRCASQGNTCEVAGRHVIRYGANNSYLYTVRNGPTLCDDNIMGDPLPGANKTCDTLPVDAEPPRCAGTQREAEDGILSGAFVVGNDASASGGAFVHVPEGSGSTGAPGRSNAQYCFTVAQAGTYSLRARVLTPDSKSDSFFVRVDGAPVDGYLWDTGTRSTYVNDQVSDRGGADPVTVRLNAGVHTVTVYLREDGARLDTLTLQNENDDSSECSGLTREAEDGELRGRFAVRTNASASGGRFIEVPQGSGNASAPNGGHDASYCFTVSQPGTYQINARVFGINNLGDSFFVTIDDEPNDGYLWDVQQAGRFTNDLVSDRDGADPVQVVLDAGTHTVRVHLREDGTRLDRISLQRLP